MFVLQAGATSQSIILKIRDTGSSPAGQGKTGLAYNTAGFSIYSTVAENGTPTAITLATQTPTGAWASGGFVAKDGTNATGDYRLDIPNALIASPGRVYLSIKGTGIFDDTVLIDVVPDNPYAAAPTITQLADGIFTRDLTALAANGTAKTLFGYLLSGGLPLERIAVSGNTVSVYESDGTTLAFTVTLTGSPTVTQLDRV